MMKSSEHFHILFCYEQAYKKKYLHLGCAKRQLENSLMIVATLCRKLSQCFCLASNLKRLSILNTALDFVQTPPREHIILLTSTEGRQRFLIGLRPLNVFPLSLDDSHKLITFNKQYFKS